eukprot:CAMPEP_0185786038 /NCGR_PEP_ID=MMETSP1174-20130828/133130_1 /TAXON_ID=35687 /ORGANISM="Dictyocha speculum, Strain CCMP1381" /LENGTH=96 /DNA_ID=CAMNT_0028478441 /DNA_START=94 /DNA_END=381 /DNA_ORIENTATION=-
MTVDRSGGKIYIHGGETQESMLSDLHTFDLQKWTWENGENVAQPPENMPTGRSQHSTVCVDNMLILYGGICDPQTHPNTLDADLHVCNLLTRKWSR